MAWHIAESRSELAYSPELWVLRCLDSWPKITVNTTSNIKYDDIFFLNIDELASLPVEHYGPCYPRYS